MRVILFTLGLGLALGIAYFMTRREKKPEPKQKIAWGPRPVDEMVN